MSKITSLEDKRRRQIQERDRSLCSWLLDTPLSLTYPFHLYPWVRVDSEIFLERLRNDARALIAHLDGQRVKPPPRAFYGALQGDIERLKQLEEEW